jgi:hypothetical protein
MTLISVDLPAPFSPTSACTSPACSANDTPFSACTPANDFRMDEAARREGFNLQSTNLQSSINLQ